MNLTTLLQQQPALWRGGASVPAPYPGIATGFDGLDRLLGGRGWPQGAITEILSDDRGGGAMAVLMPALATLSREARQIVLVAPPHIPYAPGLAARGVDLSRLLLVYPREESERLWALEQILGAGCGAVLAWPQDLTGVRLRRLQLAAERGGAAGFLFRHPETARESSPAALRLRVAVGAQEVDILKRRGGWPVHGVGLVVSGEW